MRAAHAFRAERGIDELATEGVGQLLVRQIHAALPARAHLLGPAQRLAEEVERFLLKGQGQRLRRVAHQIPCQVRLQIVQAGGADQRIHRLDEGRHVHVQFPKTRRAHFGEKLRPRKVRTEFRHRNLVIEIGRIAPGHAVERRLGEFRLEGHYGLRLLGCILRLRAREFQHFPHMRHVLLANLHRLRIGLRVVVAIRQSQAALVEIGDHLRGVLGVRARTEMEKGRGAAAGQIGDDPGDVRFTLDRRNAVEIGLERRRALGFDGRFVHARRVIVAHLLFEGTASGLGRRGVVQDLAQDIAIAVLQGVETAPARLVGRDRIGSHPGAARVAIEVHTGIGVAIDGGGVKSR